MTSNGREGTSAALEVEIVAGTRHWDPSGHGPQDAEWTRTAVVCSLGVGQSPEHDGVHRWVLVVTGMRQEMCGIRFELGREATNRRQSLGYDVEWVKTAPWPLFGVV